MNDSASCLSKFFTKWTNFDLFLGCDKNSSFCKDNMVLSVKITSRWENLLVRLRCVMSLVEGPVSCPSKTTMALSYLRRTNCEQETAISTYVLSYAQQMRCNNEPPSRT